MDHLRLAETARDGDLDTVRSLIQDSDQDPNVHSRLGPPLILASYHGRVNVLTYLLTLEGIDLNIRSESALGGESVLHAALLSDSQEVLDILFAKEVMSQLDVNAKNLEGRTPLMVAIQRENLQAFKTLVRYPMTQLEVVDRLGKTALDLATERGLSEMVSDLTDQQIERFARQRLASVYREKNAQKHGRALQQARQQIARLVEEIETGKEARRRMSELRTGLQEKCIERDSLEAGILDLKESILALEESESLLSDEQLHEKASELKELQKERNFTLMKSIQDRVDEEAAEVDCRLLEDLECPVCLLTMRPPLAIFSCSRAHLFCEMCNVDQLKSCPMCREDFSEKKPQRNLLAERWAAKIWN